MTTAFRTPVALRAPSLTAALVAAVCACSASDGPSNSGAARAQGAPAAQAGKVTEASAPSAAAVEAEQKPRPYVYSAMNRRDPFASYLTTLREQEQAEHEAQPRRETELYDASQYRLTAIISGTHRPSAMVEDPTGKGFVLRIGDTIGKHMGRITNIDATGVSFVERLYDGSGRPLEAPNVLRLPPAEDLAGPAGAR